MERFLERPDSVQSTMTSGSTRCARTIGDSGAARDLVRPEPRKGVALSAAKKEGRISRRAQSRRPSAKRRVDVGPPPVDSRGAFVNLSE